MSEGSVHESRIVSSAVDRAMGGGSHFGRNVGRSLELDPMVDAQGVASCVGCR